MKNEKMMTKRPRLSDFARENFKSLKGKGRRTDEDYESAISRLLCKGNDVDTRSIVVPSVLLRAAPPYPIPNCFDDARTSVKRRRARRLALRELLTRQQLNRR